MLVDIATTAPMAPHLQQILAILGGGDAPERISQGFYRIGHFNFDMHLGSAWDMWPHFDFKVPVNDADEEYEFNSFGVCDYPEQFMRAAGHTLAELPGDYVVSFTPVRRANEPAEGGWRWRKWGPYLGEQKPSGCEYLHDEPTIEEICVYHVYQRKVAP